MTQRCKTATVFGGTGFIGRHIVRNLARQGMRIKVAARVPERAYFLRPCGTVGQVVPFACDYRDPASIARAVEGSDYVVNCIGILSERKPRATFENIHVNLAADIARSCQNQGVECLVHISALGAGNGESRYAQTKIAGEQAVLSLAHNSVILRPGVVFGAGDSFFNTLASLAQRLPVLPLIGGGKTKFQPVYVGDVADAVTAAIAQPWAGNFFELAGPDIVSFRQIYDLLFEHTGLKRPLVSIPFSLAKRLGAALSLLPGKPLLTADQVESLKTDNVLSGDMGTLENLGITPTSMSLILPTYLGAYRAGGRFFQKTFA
ncbi:MAG: complex I NDUFA9 subunit family protein [Alphaproteobacteria bacterium]|nr:complex I NDUFA9 subunit family protein [Alphaproteobacteria bacterium]